MKNFLSPIFAVFVFITAQGQSSNGPLHPAAFSKFLVLGMGKGITVYKGERGFMKDNIKQSHPTDIVYTVVTRLEVRKLKNAIREIDDKAFVFSSSIKETAGGILKKKHTH